MLDRCYNPDCGKRVKRQMPTTKKTKTIEVPTEFLRGLIKAIRADMGFQPGLAISQWVGKLESLLKKGAEKK